MTICKGLAASTLALVLVACGGGGSSPAPSSGPVAAPAPSPTPSPTPTPTPTPGPSYSAFSELIGQQAFDMTCGAMNADLSRAVNGVIPSDDVTRATTPFGDEVALESNRDEPNYTITSLGNLLPQGSISFDQSDRDLNQTAIEAYQRNSPSGSPQFLAIDTPVLDGQPSLYIRSLRSAFKVTEDDNLQLRCAFGVPTLLSDVPDAPTDKSIADFFLISTASIANEAKAFDLDPSVITFTFDPDNSAVTFEATLSGQEILDDGTLSPEVTELGDIAATGSFDGESTNFGGTITTAGGTEIGNFAGWLFGPQGTEVAIAIRIDPSPDLELRSRGVIFLR